MMKKRELEIGTSRCQLCGRIVPSRFAYCPECRVKGWYIDELKMKRADYENYSLLAAGIINQAINDYRIIKYREGVKHFFKGKWFGLLSCGIDYRFFIDSMKRVEKNHDYTRAIEAEKVKRERERMERKVRGE